MLCHRQRGREGELVRRDDGRAKDFKKAHIEFRRYELFHVIGRPKKSRARNIRTVGGLEGGGKRDTQSEERERARGMPFLHNENVPIHKYHGPTLFTAIFFFSLLLLFLHSPGTCFLSLSHPNPHLRCQGKTVLVIACRPQ